MTESKFRLGLRAVCSSESVEETQKSSGEMASRSRREFDKSTERSIIT